MTNAVVQNTQKVAVQQKAGLLSQEATTGGFWDTPAISAEKIAPKPISVPETAPATLETIFRDNTPHGETNLIKDNITYLSVTLLTVLSLFIVFRFLKLKGVIKIDSSKIKIPSIKRKWLILILVLFVGVTSVSGAGYFGVKQYQKYQTEVTEKEKVAEEAQEQKDLIVEKLKQEVEILKNQKPRTQTIIKDVPALAPEVPTQTPLTGISLQAVIKQWEPMVAYIECKFSNPNAIYKAQGGSGIFYTTGGISIMTNRHVMLDSGGYGPDSCSIQFPNYNNNHITTIYNDGTGKQFITPYNGADAGFIVIDNPDNYIASMRDGKYCKTVPNLGDQVIMLGFPAIGSPTGITVTQGIISGYDGDYFITDAKIDHGNSGGVAINLDGNCYLGLPTWAAAGEVESLARILKWQAIHN